MPETVNCADLPEAVQRAATYAAIFLTTGDRWPNFVPVDAEKLTADSVHIRDVQLDRDPDGAWRIADGVGGRWIVRPAAEVAR